MGVSFCTPGISWPHVAENSPAECFSKNPSKMQQNDSSASVTQVMYSSYLCFFCIVRAYITKLLNLKLLPRKRQACQHILRFTAGNNTNIIHMRYVELIANNALHREPIANKHKKFFKNQL